METIFIFCLLGGVWALRLLLGDRFYTPSYTEARALKWVALVCFSILFILVLGNFFLRG